MHHSARYHVRKIKRDLFIIAISICVAIFLGTSSFFATILSHGEQFQALNSFISGIFFTSVFTTPLSVVAFVNIAEHYSIWYMAFWGAVGATIGDLILFLFIKDSLAEDVEYLLNAPRYRKWKSIFHFRLFRWLTPLIGALIIASPLPDEMGLALMGFSRMRVGLLVPISFAMNFIGILLIGLAVVSLY
jgi:hypothetical protein